MVKQNYSEKLRDPRWQKKRLEIMQRDNFRCGNCFSDQSMLSVHHYYYINGREPWEYQNESLKTLCEHCHEEYHKLMPIAINNLIATIKQTRIHPLDLQMLSQAILNINDPAKFFEVIRDCLSESDISLHTNPNIQLLNGLEI